MSLRILRTVVLKDIKLFFKNRYFALITVLGLVAYIVIYLIMPNSVDETIEIGLVSPTLPSALIEGFQDEGVILRAHESEAALKSAVTSGDLPVGVVLPQDLFATLMRREKIEAQIYFSAELPEELREVYPILVEEWISTMSGQSLNIEATEEVLGPDRAGNQIAPRDRMLPLFAVFLLMVETLGLASLISSEIAGDTLRALLVTPLSVEGLFIGKGITGVGMAFSETALLMLFTGGLSQQPILILTALFLGALMVTGIAFLIASVSKDLMSVMAWGILVILLLAIPSFSVLLPGITSDWMKILPSFYLVDAVHQVTNFDAGWAEVRVDLLALLGFAVVFLSMGVWVLRRRLR